MKIEIRNGSATIDGYVNVPGRDSKVLTSAQGKFIEQIKPQAFQRALDCTDDTPVLFNHQESRQIGSRKSGNALLREDAIGLRCTITTNDPDIIDKAKKRELRGWSFGFVAKKDTWTEPDESGIRRRTVEEMDLREVSLLDKDPAYLATSVEMRGDDADLIETRFEASCVIETVETEETRDKGGQAPPEYINHYKGIIEMMRKR